MSAHSFGVAFVYGIGGTVANAAVQSFSLNSEPKNAAQVEDEFGNNVERRKDDLHDEAEIEIKYRSTYTVPVAGSSTISYEGSTWEIQKVNRKEANKTHRIVNLTILKSQYINSATSTTITTTADPA